ncbi:hypothetical protein N9174_02120 [bacterium]|nr:hypothetical protein [bacterium]
MTEKNYDDVELVDPQIHGSMEENINFTEKKAHPIKVKKEDTHVPDNGPKYEEFFPDASSQLARCPGPMEELNGIVDYIDRSFDIMKKNIRDAKHELVKLKEELDEKDDNNERLIEKNNQLDRDLKTLKEENRMHVSKIEKRQEEMAFCSKEKNKFKTELESKKIELDKTKEDLFTFAQKYKEQNEELNKMHQIVDAIKSKEEACRKEIQLKDESIVAHRKEIQSLNGEIETLKPRYVELEEATSKDLTVKLKTVFGAESELTTFILKMKNALSLKLGNICLHSLPLVDSGFEVRDVKSPNIKNLIILSSRFLDNIKGIDFPERRAFLDQISSYLSQFHAQYDFINEEGQPYNHERHEVSGTQPQVSEDSRVKTMRSFRVINKDGSTYKRAIVKFD